MNRRRLTAMLLALVMALAMALSGCGAKSGDSGAAAKTPAAVEETETVVTADTREDAKKLADAFYDPILKANSLSMTTWMDGEQASVFTKEGDTLFSTDGTPEFEYYMFIEDGEKYILEGDEAYENEYLYDMFADSLEFTLTMFVTGLYDADEEDGITFSATQTDKTVNGATTSTLVSVFTGEEDGQPATLTVTGTAENGTVTNIRYEMASGEEKQSAEFRFAYDNIHIELPDYTIVEGDGYGSYGTVVEGEHVDSPYATLAELIATVGEEDYLRYTMEDGRVYALGEKDGRQLQFSAPISEEDTDAINNMDFFSDTYYEDIYAILGKLAVDDCIDYTGSILPKEELDGYAGKTVQALVDEGFEVNGWGIGDGEATLYATKDGMEYNVKATPTEGFDENSDFEKEDLYGFTVKEISFSEPEYSALPIR